MFCHFSTTFFPVQIHLPDQTNYLLSQRQHGTLKIYIYARGTSYFKIGAHASSPDVELFNSEDSYKRSELLVSQF